MNEIEQRPLGERMKMAVNELRSAARLAQLRFQAAFGRNTGSLDSKRPLAWCEYGFPADVTFNDLYGLYRRNGLARGCVDKLVQNCWKTAPGVIQGEEKDNDEQETAWEKGLRPIIKTSRMWREFALADSMRLVGRFSGILLQFREPSPNWDKPVSRNAVLVKMIPVWAGSLTVGEWDTSPTSENYGKPKNWVFKEVNVTNGQPGRQMTIDPSRIFILGDYTGDATGFLEPVYNNFVSIEKIEGGSGESYLKNASRQIAMNFDPAVQLEQIAASHGVPVKDLKKMFDQGGKDFNAMMDSMMITQGADVKVLTSSVPDPEPHYNINLQSISSGVDMPTKIIVGMQTGERASTEDQKYMNSRCQSRREGVLSYDISDFILQLQSIGVVAPVEEFTVVWDNLSESTLAEKLANGKIMTEINTTSAGNGAPLYLDSEIREVTGFEPIDEEALRKEMESKLPDDVEEEDEEDPLNPDDPVVEQ